MAPNPKVLVVGVDAMDKDLIHEWADDGQLPALSALMARGLKGSSGNPPRRYSGALWPCFYTGVGPDRHGQYIHTEFDPETYKFTPVRPAVDRHPPFWIQDGFADKRLAIVNVPFAPLTENLNGVQVVEWGVHDRHVGGLRTCPSSFARDLLARYGADPVGFCEINDRTVAEFASFRDRLLGRIRQKTDLARDLMGQGGWDLFVMTYDETHCVGHQCWHLHDTAHPLHDPAVAATLGNPMRDVYRAIDTALGRLLEQTGTDTTVLFLASHGMGPGYDGNIVLDEILRRIDGAQSTPGAGAARLIRRLWRALPSRSRNLLRPLREMVDAPLYQSLTAGDRRSRRCFAIQTHDQCGGIRVNLKGRESDGKVEPGPEFEAYTEGLIRDLYDLVDGRSHQPIVERIWRSSEIEFGNHVGDKADLILQWRVPTLWSVESPKIGKLDPVYMSKKGDHKPGGLFVASGPNIARGTLSDPVSVADFAPTLARLLGVELAGVDGKPIPALVPGAAA